MAGRSFGGTVKLTGEKEYQNALSKIKDNLTLVSSELKVVSNTFDKNNASINDLNNTNDVLNKKLDIQKDKVRTLEKVLSDAEKETGKNSVTVKKWQTELNKAQAEVNKTTLEIRQNKSQIEKLTKEEKEASNETNNLGNAFNKAGDKALDFGDILKGNVLADFVTEGIKQIAETIGTVTKEFMTFGNEVSKSTNKMKASLGLTNEETEKYKAIMEDIYNNNYGESFEDIASKIAYVKQVTGEVDPSKIQELTENAIALEDTFGSDFNETIRGVTNLIKHFGIDSTEAFDLFAKGSQHGLDYTSELGDNIAEYGGNFKQAGYSAQEYFQLLENGSQGGAYNLDKVNDSINEIKNRLGDGTIKDNLSLYSSETQKAFKNWENGKGTMKDVIDSIVNDISKCDNEQKKLNMAATAFGTMGEDANLQVVESLNTLGDSYEDVEETMNDIKDIRYDDLGSAFEGIKRQMETNLITPMYNDLLPAFNEFTTEIQKSLDEGNFDATSMGNAVGKLISDVSIQMLEKLPELAEFIISGVTGLVESIDLGKIADTLLTGLVSALGSIAEKLPELIPDIISGIIDALGSFNEHIDEIFGVAFQIIQGLIQGLINSIPEIIKNLPTILMAIVNFFALSKFLKLGTNIIKGLWNGIKGLVPTLKGWIKGLGKNIIDFFKNPLQGIKNIGKNLVQGLWNGIKNAKDWVLDKIKGFGKSILNGLKSFFGIKSPSRLFRDQIGKNLALGIGVGFENEIGGVTNKIKSSIPTKYDLDLVTGVSTDFQGSGRTIGNTDSHNFNVTINNNSKYTSPAENTRLFRQEYEMYKLKHGKVGA